MQQKSTNGFTTEEIDRALQGLDLPVLVRVRAELLDLDNVVLYQLSGLQNTGAISHNVNQPMQRTANLSFVETARDNMHPAPLTTFILTVAGQSRLFHLRLNEASGNAVDYTGNGRTFTANGGITYSLGSLGLGDTSDNAIKLNGTTGYYSIAHAAWQDVTTGLSVVMAWKGTGTSDVLFDSGGAHTLSLASGRLQWMLAFTTGSPVTYSTGFEINDTKAHLIHCTYNGAFVNVYIDGKRLVHTAETRTLHASTGLQVGVSGATFSSGTFDEVGMLSRALSSKEIRDEYQAWSAQTNELLLDKDRGDRIRIYYGARMPHIGTDLTDTAEWAQITAILTSPKRDYSKTGTIITVTCQDQTRVLQDYSFSSVTTVAAGQNYLTGTNGVLALAALAGLTTTDWSVTSTTLTVPADIVFEVGDNTLSAINYLLTAINYKPIRFAGAGSAILEPNILDMNLPVSDTINSTITKVISAESLSMEVELRRLVREVTVANGNPDVSPIRAVATSTIVVKGESVVYQVDVADTTTATNLSTQFLQDEIATLAKRVRLHTLPRPWHEDRDRYDLIIPEIGIPTSEGYVEDSWTLPLDGSAMEHLLLSIATVL